MQNIQEFLNDFNISDEDIKARDNFNEYLVSLASVLVDEFYALYLKPNAELMRYLEHTDGALLLKRIKDFFVFIFSAPMDELYFKRIEYIGFVHFSIKLPPSKVSYGFWAINQLIVKMAEVNDVVKSSHGLISKILVLVEHVMNDSYNQHERKRSGDKAQDNQLLGTFDTLYSALQIHRVNLKKIASYHEGTLKKKELLESIMLDPEHCTMGKMLSQLQENRAFIESFGVNIMAIEALHVRWHENFSKFIADDISQSQAHECMIQMQALTEEITALVDIPLKEYSNDSFLSLNSGIKAMHYMVEIFHLKPLASEDDNIMYLMDTFEKNLNAHFSWAFASIVIQDAIPDTINYDLYRVLHYANQRIYIGINIKEGVERSYLLEMLSLLFEAFDMNLSIKERERSLMHFADKAESANRAKDIFLANMSHELRTPLNAITGFSQILMMRPDTPDGVKGYVEKINMAGGNLLNLVNTILDFAKLESGKMQFNPQLSSLSEILNEVKILVTPMADKKSIAISFPNVQSLSLLLDANLFKQVLINLMSNAIKFTPDSGSVALDVSYDKALKEYVFGVKDNGVGISLENQKALFQAFSQIDNVYQKEQKGTGLGLMISKKIVEELHQGRLWVESQEGEGSCFYIALPIPFIESHTYMVSQAQGDQQLLVVEDSVEYQELIADHLKEDYNITFTDTVNRAKELLISNRYDFIILDYFLIDGVSSEILQFMDEENIDITCIVISAEDDVHIAQSLSGFSNLKSILSKDDIHDICSALKTSKEVL